MMMMMMMTKTMMMMMMMMTMTMMMIMMMMMVVRRCVQKRCMRARSEAMPEDAFRSEALTLNKCFRSKSQESSPILLPTCATSRDSSNFTTSSRRCSSCTCCSASSSRRISGGFTVENWARDFMRTQWSKMVIYSGFTHWKWWFSIVMLVYQRVI